MFAQPITLNFAINTATTSNGVKTLGKYPRNGESFQLSVRRTSGAWTSATLGVKGSRDGENFYPIHDGVGFVGSSAVATTHALTFEVPAGYQEYRLWSHDGSGNDTNQAAAETFEVFLEG